MLRTIGGLLLKFLVFLGGILLLITQPVNHSRWENTPDYAATFRQIAATNFTLPKSVEPLRAGWAKCNITPSDAAYLVGYQPRGPHTAVHDSLFVRAMVFESGQKTVCLLSYDLLLAPPAVAEQVRKRLSETSPNTAVYFTATHTHTGFGGWDSQPASRFITASFRPKRFEALVNQSLQAIAAAKANAETAHLGFLKIDAHNWVENRLDQSAQTDGFLRAVKVQKNSGEQAVILAYSAHATNISSEIYQLSGDYPAALVTDLEKKAVNFALFAAGMVGSHRAKGDGTTNFRFTENIGKMLSKRLQKALPNVKLQANVPIAYHNIPINLPPPQLRFAQNYCLRSGVFEYLLGKLNASVSCLRLGEILLLGMPCDFSGEISINKNFDKIASSKNIKLLITSFNGNYIGYITPDKYYDTKNKEEVRAMNWVGPRKGAYFAKIIGQIIEKQNSF